MFILHRINYVGMYVQLYIILLGIYLVLTNIKNSSRLQLEKWKCENLSTYHIVTYHIVSSSGESIWENIIQMQSLLENWNGMKSWKEAMRK